MEKRYQIIFLGLHGTPEGFKDLMLMLGISLEMCQVMINKAPVIMKKDLSLKDARRYADAIDAAGGKVNIKESGVIEDDGRNDSWFNMVTLKSFTACPQCGYKQVKKMSCIKCGFFFEEISQGY